MPNKIMQIILFAYSTSLLSMEKNTFKGPFIEKSKINIETYETCIIDKKDGFRCRLVHGQLVKFYGVSKDFLLEKSKINIETYEACIINRKDGFRFRLFPGQLIKVNGAYFGPNYLDAEEDFEKENSRNNKKLKALQKLEKK